MVFRFNASPSSMAGVIVPFTSILARSISSALALSFRIRRFSIFCAFSAASSYARSCAVSRYLVTLPSILMPSLSIAGVDRNASLGMMICSAVSSFSAFLCCRFFHAAFKASYCSSVISGSRYRFTPSPCRCLAVSSIRPTSLAAPPFSSPTALLLIRSANCSGVSLSLSTYWIHSRMVPRLACSSSVSTSGSSGIGS